jgi:photosystem II stability/assembly factor-like uncharacterized protein
MPGITSRRFDSHATSLVSAVLLAACCVLIGCTGDDDDGAPPPPDYQWTSRGPSGGWVSSVAFHPARAGEIWASGDDSSGLFRSTDSGATWQQIVSVPFDQATYSLTFDPTNPDRVYAPNHFGRGFLKSSDGGATWSITRTGLPPADPEHRLYDMAVDPSSPSCIYVCTAGGLYRSVDYGDSFTQITSATFGAETDFRSAAVSGTGHAFTGTAGGGVYKTIDGGTTWTQVIAAGSGIPVSDIVLSAHALYVGFNLGVIVKSTTFDAAGVSIINNPSVAGSVVSYMWTRLAVVSGASAATDTLYVGTVDDTVNTQWGFLVSADGGATYTRRMTGLDPESVFSLAVDPTDADHVVCGTIGGGLFVTADQGLAWTKSDDGLVAGASLGFAEDAGDPLHLVISSAEALDQTPGAYETFDGGATWSLIATLPVDVAAFDIDPIDPLVILAGTFKANAGILRTTSGAGGTWTTVLATNVEVIRFVRDRVNAQLVYAVATDHAAPASDADEVLYVSTNGGAAWSPRTSFAIADVAPHPTVTEEAVAVSADAYATEDAFATAPTPLGLAAAAPPGTLFTCAAFDPADASTLLVGTSTGALWVTDGYSPDGIGLAWSEVTNPAQDAIPRRIIIDSDGVAATWYVSLFVGDSMNEPTSTPGIMRSRNRGATWDFVHAGIGPSRLVWDLHPSPSVAKRFWAGMWGGGLRRLDVD